MNRERPTSRGFGRPSYARDENPNQPYQRERYREEVDPRETRRAEEYSRDRERGGGGRYSRYEHRPVDVVSNFTPRSASEQGGGRLRYNYGSGRTHDGRESLIQPFSEKEHTEEQRLKEAYINANYSITDIQHAIYTRTEGIGRVINETMELFKHPNGLKRPDPVFAEFISDLRMNGDLYVYNVAQYISMGLVDVVANHAYNGGKRLEPQQMVAKIELVTLKVLLLEFGNWLTDIDDAWGLLYKLTPQARRKLESRDEDIDLFVNSINAVLAYNDAPTAFTAPWSKHLLDRVQRTAPSTSPTYDAYIANTDFEFGTITTPRVYDNLPEAPVHRSKDWDQSAWNAWAEMAQDKGKSVNGTVMKMRQEKPSCPDWINDNWTEQLTSQKEAEKKIDHDSLVTLDNIHEFDLAGVNPLKWFREVPGMLDTYVIRPSDFKAISRCLVCKSNKRDYFDWVYRFANKMPVVNLDWVSGTYDYILVPVENNEEIEMILTNPELVIPKLETRTEEEQVADYQAYQATLEELDKKRQAEENDPNAVRELSTEPKIIYANKPYMFEQRKRLNLTTEALNDKAEAKCGSEVDVVVLPFSDCAELNFKGLAGDEIAAAFPYLVSGNDFDYTFEQFLHRITRTFELREQTGINATAWNRLKYTINRHICTVINRWLVEERYYGATRKDRNFLAIKDIYTSGEELLEELQQNDGPSYRILSALWKSKFLVERLQLLASPEDVDAFATQSSKNADPELREGIKENIINNSTILIAKGNLVRVNKATPLDNDGPKVIERSSNPEIFYLLDEVPVKMAKHFDRQVPVYITFGRDINKTIWSVTRSGFDSNKAMLVPIEDHQSIALQRTSISEITLTPKS